MIPASGAGGPGFKSRLSPNYFFNSTTLTIDQSKHIKHQTNKHLTHLSTGCHGLLWCGCGIVELFGTMRAHWTEGMYSALNCTLYGRQQLVDQLSFVQIGVFGFRLDIVFAMGNHDLKDIFDQLPYIEGHPLIIPFDIHWVWQSHGGNIWPRLAKATRNEKELDLYGSCSGLWKPQDIHSKSSPLRIQTPSLTTTTPNLTIFYTMETQRRNGLFHGEVRIL